MTKLYEKLAASNCPLCREALDHIRQLAAGSILNAFSATPEGQNLLASLDQLQAKGHLTVKGVAPNHEPRQVRVFRRAHEKYAERTGYNIMQYGNAGEMSRVWNECHTAAWAEIRAEDENERYTPRPLGPVETKMRDLFKRSLGEPYVIPEPDERAAIAEKAKAEAAPLHAKTKNLLDAIREARNAEEGFSVPSRADAQSDQYGGMAPRPFGLSPADGEPFATPEPLLKGLKGYYTERYRKGGRTIDEKMKDLAEQYGGMAPRPFKGDTGEPVEKVMVARGCAVGKTVYLPGEVREVVVRGTISKPTVDGLHVCANCTQAVADCDQPAEVAGDQFYPCPHCGHDMFSGEEFKQ